MSAANWVDERDDTPVVDREPICTGVKAATWVEVSSPIPVEVRLWSWNGDRPWIWVVLSGVITLLLGLLILAHWPVSSLYILGVFLGIDLVMAGAAWIGLGFGLRRGR